jgi:hypothetical protein
MTTVRQERIGRLNAFDEFADRRLATDRERVVEARESSAIKERLQRQSDEQNGKSDAAA